MSILTHQPTTPTDQQILDAKINFIKKVAKVSFLKQNEIQKNGIDILWKDSKFTPQQIIDALGPDAIKIFEMHGILTDAITQIADIDGIETAVSLPTNAFEVVDGLIVVSEDPYVAQ